MTPHAIRANSEQQTKKMTCISAGHLKLWWPGTESNRRHGDFQSPALPTELPGHFIAALPLARTRIIRRYEGFGKRFAKKISHLFPSPCPKTRKCLIQRVRRQQRNA